MAKRAWDRRGEFDSRLISPYEAVHHAARAQNTPVALFDVGDNVGGGSPGDSTILLEELRRQSVLNYLVVLYDPESVAQCVEAGVRNQVSLEVGAKTDSLHGSPVSIHGTVRVIADGVFVEHEVRHGGWGRNDQGLTAVVDTAGDGSIVLTSRRMAPMSLQQILSVGCQPQTKRAIVVKGVVAPRAAYEPVCREILLVDTPGVTAGNPAHFAYRNRRRPLYPLEMDASYLPESFF
jgi:microcystin degradation protein MlrC